MKKTLLRLKLKLLITPQSSLSKTLLFMKMTVLLILLTTLQAVAGDANAQLVTIQLNQVAMPNVFKAIEKQSEYRFLYNYDLPALQKKVNINLEAQSVAAILDNVLLGTGLTFKKLDNNLIVIIPLESSEFFEDRKITGTIKDDAGKAVAGASVYIKNKSTGTTTNASGQFTIIGEVGQTIVIQAVNYESLEVIISNQKSFDYVLKSSISNLEEVVVVGYGTVKKVNLTGAISTVSSKQIESRPIANTQQALKGLVPNLNITVSNAGGEPGASMDMSIRGLQNFGGNNAPLVLVDNILMDINNVNPNDIESISILKDAASSAIYGARAAYGVILITTKTGKGTKGKTNISYQSNMIFSKPVQFPRLVDAMTFALVSNDAAKNIGNSPWYNADALDRLAKNIAQPGSAPEMLGAANGLTWNIGAMGLGAAANTDWYDIFFKDYSVRKKNDLSVSGSSEKMDYYLSAGWWDEQGLLKYGNESFDRYNFDAKINAKASSWAKVAVLFKYNYGLEKFPWQADLGRGRIYDMMTKMKPTMPAKYPGTNIWTQESRIDEWATQRDNSNNSQMVLAPRLILEPIKGWVTNIEFNYTTSNNRQELSAKQYFWMQPNGELAPGLPKANTSYRPRLYTDTYLSPNLYSTYTKSINKHNFSAMVGYQQEKYNYFALNSDALYLLSDNIPSINTAVGAKTVSDGQGHWATQSGFGRLSYNYNEKYLIESNFRADGSSRFEPTKQWGYFPSVSAGWVVSKEKFFTNKNVINLLKFRSSYGDLGNQNVANYLYIPTMGISQSGYLFSGQKLWTVGAPNISSVDLTWEKIKTLDFGVDMAFFRNRLTSTLDWYESLTNNLVGPGPAIPAVLGTSVPKENSGEIRTRGFELELSWRDQIDDFSYQIGFNLANNKSVVMSYNNPTGLLSTYYKGQVLGEIWGYNTPGIFQTVEEVNGWANQSFLWAGKWNPGDLKYQDMNNDGKIDNGKNTDTDHGDMVLLGNQLPQYTYGFNANANWKGFDFSILFQGVAKQDLYITEIYNGNVFRGPANGPLHMMVYEEHMDYWRDASSPLGANPNAYYAKPYSVFDGDNSKNYGRPVSRYLPSGAYLRMKNVRLGYTIPEKLTNKLLIKRANIYFSGENLFVIKQIKLLDPEQTGGRNGDGRTYPLSKSLSVGLNINF